MTPHSLLLKGALILNRSSALFTMQSDLNKLLYTHGRFTKTSVKVGVRVQAHNKKEKKDSSVKLPH